MTKLAAYRAKRDFGRTPEPEGTASEAEGFAFVIQEHDATRLHYDLRLELDGVMKSWAVAKGPSLVPGEKRLAIHVEDHPIAYNSFEGTIPKGQYGGGTVLLWDRGRWEPAADPRRGYEKGHLDFRLHGEKLGGAWHLVRIRKKAGERQDPWLLIKSDDDFARSADAPDILEEKPLSVESGRDLAAIAADAKGDVWDSRTGLAAEGRAGTKKPGSSSDPRAEVAGGAGPRSTRKRGTSVEADLPSAPRDKGGGGSRSGSISKPDPMPREVEPCLATLVGQVPHGDAWLHEIKWDGYRLIAFKARGKVRLATRRGLDWTARFPAIAEAVAALPVETAILDGEAIVEDGSGVASFSALQAALSDEGGRIAREAVLVAFDLLYLEGEDLRGRPLADRKARLAGLLPATERGGLRLGEHLDVDGEAMRRSACRLGLEGVISKRRDRPYRPGRGDDWLKVKCTERQEFVIAGFTASKAGTRAVGSVVLGYHEAGELRAAGRAGTGFTAESAREIWRRLSPLERARAPFARRPTAEERRGVTWVEPQLVAEIEFRGWTGDDHLRHAAFKGLREDKAAAEVVRERPADEPAPAPEPAPPKRPAAKAGRGAGDTVAGVTLTHPGRVLWEEDGLTKRDLAAYAEAVAEWLLPQVASRPLSLVRCPAGIGAHCFFQKHSWAGLSDAIRRESVRDEAGEEEVLYVEDLPGLVALVQASVIEIHPWGATIADVDRPDRIVMDLDPGEGVPWETVVEGARDVRERLGADGLESFVKTTGGKGLHVVVPLDGAAEWARVKAYAKALADRMEGEAPDRYLARSTKAARRGRIYVDYLRNGRGATAVAAYSARARAGATVSVPISWAELKPSLDPATFTILTLPRRLARLKSDPWAAMAGISQGLPPATGRAKRRG